MGGRVRMNDGGLLYINNRSHAKRISSDDLRNCICSQLKNESMEEDSDGEDEDEEDRCSSHSDFGIKGKQT